MKTYSALVMALTIMTLEPAVQAQTCTSPITSWRGNYSLSASGSVSCAGGTCTIDESAGADVNANSASIGCGLAQWSGTDNVTTDVLNNKAVDDCGDGTETVETIVGTSTNGRPPGSAGEAVEV